MNAHERERELLESMIPYICVAYTCFICMPYTHRNTVSFSVDGKDLGIAYTSVPKSDLFAVVNIPLKGSLYPYTFPGGE